MNENAMASLLPSFLYRTHIRLLYLTIDRIYSISLQGDEQHRRKNAPHNLCEEWIANVKKVVDVAGVGGYCSISVRSWLHHVNADSELQPLPRIFPPPLDKRQ